MGLDPQIETLLEQFRTLGFPGFAAMDVAAARKMFDEMPHLAGEPVARVEDRVVPGPGGDIPVRVYVPEGEGPLPLLVYFHGGGWTVGGLEGYDLLCRGLANHAGCVVVSVDYRLGPEHRFPAAVEDAVSATRWAAEHAAALGADPARLAVGGDSAGGNLSAVVTLAARDSGGPDIAFQLLIYPATDMIRDDWPSYRENGEGYFLTLRDMEWFTSHYVRPDTDLEDWRLSPARAASHAGLPPALVVTAEFDPLRDQGEAYGDQLRNAGVAVRTIRYPGMIHGFVGMELLDGARTALDDMAEELRSALASPR